MRLRFWRRKDADPQGKDSDPQGKDSALQWCDRPEHDWWAEGTVRSLTLRHVSIELLVGLADVGLEIGRIGSDKYQVHRRYWELSQFPVDRSTLHLQLRTFLVKCSCDDLLAERVAEAILKELAGLVANARVERERRLSLLPAAASFEWIERDVIPCDRHTQGIHIADDGSIMVCLTYGRAELTYVHHPVGRPVASIVSTRPGRAEQNSGNVPVPVDGLSCDTVGEFLENIGWPTEVARSVDRAVAVRARADWMARLSSVDQWRKAFDADGWTWEVPSHAESVRWSDEKAATIAAGCPGRIPHDFLRTGGP